MGLFESHKNVKFCFGKRRDNGDKKIDMHNSRTNFTGMLDLLI